MRKGLPTSNDKARFLASFAKLMPELLLSICESGLRRNKGLGTGLDDSTAWAEPVQICWQGQTNSGALASAASHFQLEKKKRAVKAGLFEYSGGLLVCCEFGRPTSIRAEMSGNERLDGMVQARGVELSFSHLPGPVVRCSSWAGGEGCRMRGRSDDENKARGQPFEGRFLTVRIFSQQSFCKTTSRAKRRDILACRRTDLVVLGRDERNNA